MTWIKTELTTFALRIIQLSGKLRFFSILLTSRRGTNFNHYPMNSDKSAGRNLLEKEFVHLKDGYRFLLWVCGIEPISLPIDVLWCVDWQVYLGSTGIDF